MKTLPALAVFSKNIFFERPQAEFQINAIPDYTPIF
jgi:hypothetical protein